MSLQLEETSAAGEGRPKVPKAVKWVPLVGKGVGRAGKVVWRAVRRTTRVRRRMGPFNRSLTRPSMQAAGTHADQALPVTPFWSAPGSPLWDLSTPAMLSVAGPPAWLPRPLQQLLWPFADSTFSEECEYSVHKAAAAAATSGSNNCRASRRRERRAVRQQRRAHKRIQKQLQKASKASAAAEAATGAAASSAATGIATAAASSGSTTRSSSSILLDISSTAADTPMASGSSSSGKQMDRSNDVILTPANSGLGGGWGTHVLAQMINTANTFPMLLHSAQHLQQQQQQQQQPDNTDEDDANAQSTFSSLAEQQQVQQWSAVSSSALGGTAQLRSRPQQLLTVGCRHWGNGMVQGLLRVKIYDFAIYLDSKQAQTHLPTTTLLLEGTDSPSLQLKQQQQQQHQDDHDLPAVLKCSHTPVDMSLVLKAARDVPLHLLSAEYEKVLRRRLDRVGGSSDDITALQQLLASFSDASRLPAAVTVSSSSSSSDGQLPAGGSVRKGAMIVFERSRAGDVTARVGPVILGTVSSPKVAEALFDLYLGEQPVSKSAKEAAAQTLQRIAAAPSADARRTTAAAAAGGGGGGGCGVSAQVHEEGSGSSVKQQQQQPLAGYYLPNTKGHEIQCEGGKGASGQKQKKKGNGGGGSTAAVAAGLEVEDLHACVLHMG